MSAPPWTRQNIRGCDYSFDQDLSFRLTVYFLLGPRGGAHLTAGLWGQANNRWHGMGMGAPLGPGKKNRVQFRQGLWIRFFSCRVQGGALISQRGHEVKRTAAGTAWVYVPLTCGAGPNHALLQSQLRTIGFFLGKGDLCFM